MKSLLYLPNPLSFLIVAIVSAAISLIGLKLVRRKFSPDLLKENHEVAGYIFNAFGLLYAVLIAFVVYATWTGYDNSKNNAEMEANKLSEIFMDAKGLPDSNRIIIQNLLLNYAVTLKDDEWVKMVQGERSNAARELMDNIFTEYLKMDVKTIPNPYIYQESLKRLNEILEYRRLRLFSNSNSIPDVIWIVVIIGAVISVGYTYLFGVKSQIAQYIMTSTLAITNSLVLFLIYILNHPFTGTNAISSMPLGVTIRMFRHMLGM
jgi:hypothetical protein